MAFQLSHSVRAEVLLDLIDGKHEQLLPSLHRFFLISVHQAL